MAQPLCLFLLKMECGQQIRRSPALLAIIPINGFQENNEKANLIYGAIDDSGGFYKNPIPPEDRSQMNVVFRLTTEDLEKKFVTEGLAAGFLGLKGHRSVGGIRVSIYNANGLDSVQDVVSFMKDFAAKNG